MIELGRLAMSSIIIHALESSVPRSLGMPVDGKYADDYREFCGLWSAAEFIAFNASLAENSRIDTTDLLA